MSVLMSMPLVGTGIEVCGVLGNFIGADLMSSGDCYFMIKGSSSNVRLIERTLGDQSVHCIRVSEELIQVPVGVCKWRSVPGGGLFDTETQEMEGRTEGCYQATKVANTFQIMLSRRSRV